DTGSAQAMLDLLGFHRRREEGEKTGTLLRAPRTSNLPAAGAQALGSVDGQSENMLLHALRPEPKQHFYRSVKPPDAGKVFQRGLEARGAGAVGGQVVIEMSFALFDAVIADMRR